MLGDIPPSWLRLLGGEQGPHEHRTQTKGRTLSFLKARHREVDETDGTCVLREPRGAYARTFGTENSALRPDNTTLWTENPANA